MGVLPVKLWNRMVLQGVEPGTTQNQTADALSTSCYRYTTKPWRLLNEVLLRVGLEPTPLSGRDFKSRAATYFATEVTHRCSYLDLNQDLCLIRSVC